jgi:hypothetical protein
MFRNFVESYPSRQDDALKVSGGILRHALYIHTTPLFRMIINYENH